MTRTLETWDVFSRDIAAVRRMKGYTPEFITATLEREAKRHADYDQSFDRMKAAVEAIANPVWRRSACKLLLKSGGPGCLSGSWEFRAASDALSPYGILIHTVFCHDRHWIGTYCQGESGVETSEAA